MDTQTILITGASSGIGAATAQLFASAGYNLVLLARRIELIQRLNLPRSLCLAVDVTDAQAVTQAIVTAKAKFGEINGLINNAGIATGGEFTQIQQTEHQRMIEVNILGVLNCTHAVLPDMQARNHGTIINLSSVADRHGRPNLATYAASKAAIKSLSESLRAANAKYGIRVCNIAPAKIATPMLLTSDLKDDQIIAAETMAQTLLWVYQQPQHVCIRDLVIAPTYYEL